MAALAALGLGVGIAAGIIFRDGNQASTDKTAIKPPDFAYAATAPRGAVEAYQFAIDHPDILAQIPCYCGCGELDGHKSNLDCFIKSREGDEVVFDDHGSY